MGDYKTAHENHLLAKQAKEEIYLERNKNLITVMEVTSKDERAKAGLICWLGDNELKSLAIRQSRMMFFGFAALFLAVVLAMLFLWRMNRLKIRNRALVHEQKLLYDLELKKLETEKLVELDRLKSRFFANISHEFRTPLTLIMGPVDKVLAQTDDKDHKKELGIARKYAGKLQTLINNLLNISRLESGNLQLHAAQIDIVKLVRSYLQAFESLARKKHIALNFSASEDTINVFLDREKFEQILNNLFSNAVKFTGEGGVIEVTIGRVQPAGSSGQEVEIRVSDTGMGIAPEHLGHVFDRFYQVEHKEKSYYEGTGIGLALTKELVELHRGIISVESEPGKGACFILHLPLGKDHLALEEIADGSKAVTAAPAMPVEMPDGGDVPVPTEEAVAGANGNQPILLIVEDNADMRAYIREYFESAYSIIEATDGMDGLEKSLEHTPDIIISDVMMPVMDGNEFCRKVKTDERTSHIPVILLTARASAGNKLEGLETGADDFISKPFDGKELQARVKNLVEQRKKLRELLEARIRRSVNALQPDLSGSGIASMDERFMQRVFEKLREHYTESMFGATEFSSAVGLSISQLNRKIRALTGETTIGLIRTYRLNRASELLRSKSATVAEIAYDVGFSSPSYFTECFRQHFGKPPTEY
ncbi:MAG: ATP-binding protein [Bacteroidales bacterium]